MFNHSFNVYEIYFYFYFQTYEFIHFLMMVMHNNSLVCYTPSFELIRGPLYFFAFLSFFQFLDSPSQCL
jgi:hypothetical protein